MFATILQNGTNTTQPVYYTVPAAVWDSMNLQFNIAFIGAVGLAIALAIVGFLVLFSPASAIISAKLHGGRALIAFRRDGTYQIKALRYRRGFLFAKDGIHQVIPNAMHYNKGLSMGACWEESGTAIPIEMAAAMGLLSKIGIEDAETLELFNFYLKDPDGFNVALTDPDKQALELLPSADASGTFRALVDHAKEVYAITDDMTLLVRFQSIRRRIPYISNKEEAKKFRAWRLPYWYSLQKGLVTNVMGMMLPWTDIKNFQIYHQHPANLMGMVDQESDRKARKVPKDKMAMIAVIGLVGAVVVGVMVLAWKFLGG